jgi:hypothetical protein
VVTAAGLALFGTLASSLTAALMDEGHREAALLTFVVAASGVTIAGLGSPLVGGTGRWQRKLAAEGAPQKHAGHQAGDAGQKLSLCQKTMAACVQAAIFIGRTG